MRNIVLLLSVFTLSVTAQEIEKDIVNVHKNLKQTVNNDKSATVIWAEDFGNGFPSSWDRVTSNVSGGFATCNWVWSDDGSWGNFSGGGTASPDAAINSTTASNGFLISDIDSANHFANGQPSGSNYEYIDSYFITEAVNTVGYPSVSLEFEHNFRFNNSIDLVVSVSNDSVSWIDFFVQGSATNNQESADPELLNLNISCVAGDQPTVYVKVGWSARVYYWMIDDMRIIETPNNVLELVETNYGGWFTTPTTEGYGLDYSFFPLNQAIAHPYVFEGVVKNLGGQPQTTKLNIDVFDVNGVGIFSATSNDSILSPQDAACDFDERVFKGVSGFVPSSIGEYQFNLWGSSDSALTDTISMVSTVTDDVYGRDNGNQYDEYGLGRSCGGMIIGTYFDVFTADNAKSLSVYIDDKSVPGAEIYAAIYEIDSNNDKYLLEESSNYTLLASDIGSWIELPFDNTISLSEQTYMAAVGGFVHPFDTSLVAMSRTARPTTCYIQKNGCLNTGQSLGNWYWLSRVPMIRMNMGMASSVEENIFQGSLEIYPNPADDKFVLEFNNVNPDSYHIVIRNVFGQTIFDEKTRVSGFYKKGIEVSNFAKGIYFVSVSSSLYEITEKLVLE